MEKGEDDLVDQSDDEDTASTHEETDNVTKTDKGNEETKENTDSLRKVIKLEPSEKNPTGQQEKNEDSNQGEQISFDEETTGREALEQKRAILQSIKDFDFQIKKNQEELTLLNNRVDSVLKDLDDLVSLYEIVSEQMNPFVGLSKVTKKRIDALENFTREVGEIKERMGDLESFAERTGSNFAEIKALRRKTSTDKKDDMNKELGDLSAEDLDVIIEKSFGEINADRKIDVAIDEFIENIKDWNMK